MIHVTFNIDSNYVKHCAVTMVSLLHNNRGEAFAIHIVTDSLSDKDKAVLNSLAAEYGAQVMYYTPRLDMLQGFEIRKFSKRISMATYYRCILSDLLPQSIDRVLYLDCDIVVCGSVKAFWQTPLDGIGVAAIEDVGCREAERYDVLKYPSAYSYFNAGVMLVNLQYWREHNMAKACVDYYHKYPERILFNDQDLLNSLLYKNKVLVDLKWNVQDGFYRRKYVPAEHLRTSWSEALRQPVILHYTNRKPWEYDSQHPLREEYYRYLDLTPWRGERTLSSFANRVRRFVRLFPFFVGLRKAKYIRL